MNRSSTEVVMPESLRIMLAQFEEAPGDFDGYAACADLYDEFDLPDLAHAFRWMWKRRKCPHKRLWHNIGSSSEPVQGRKVPPAHRWAWYGGHGSEMWKFIPFGNRPHCFVPDEVLMSPYSKKVFRTHLEAVEYLSTRLSYLQFLYGIEPNKGV